MNCCMRGSAEAAKASRNAGPGLCCSVARLHSTLLRCCVLYLHGKQRLCLVEPFLPKQRKNKQELNYRMLMMASCVLVQIWEHMGHSCPEELSLQRVCLHGCKGPHDVRHPLHRYTTSEGSQRSSGIRQEKLYH